MNTLASTIENDASPEHWAQYAQGIAWGTVSLCVVVVLGYAALMTAIISGELSLAWGTLSATFLLYLAFTVAHEAGHGNIAHEVSWMKPVERAMGWLMTLPFLLVPFAMFARIHDYHHAHTNHPDKDPDHWVSGDNWKEAGPRATTLPLQYCYLILTRFRKDPVIKATHKSSLLYFTFTLSLVSILLAAGYGLELLMLGILPTFMVSFILGMLFDWIPHMPTKHQERYQNTRVYLFPGLKYLTLGQNYHLIHHLYPRVSWYHYARVFDLIRPELEAKNAPIETLFTKHEAPFGESPYALEPSEVNNANKLTLRVQEIQRETPDAVRITFENMQSKCISFEAGQYVTVSKLIDRELVTRCYSICTDPDSGRLSIGVKQQPGGRMSSYLNNKLKVGDELTVAGPFGDFVLPADRLVNELLLIAGGSGITPILSIAKSALLRNTDCTVRLVYASKSLSDEMFSSELKVLQMVYGERLQLTQIYQETHKSWQGETGYLDGEKVQRILSDVDLSNVPVYLCGPDAMKQEVLPALRALNVLQEDIFVEEFVQASAPAEGPVHQVKLSMLDGSTHQIAVAENQTVLQVALEQGLSMPYACGVGQCGCCMMKVETGESELMQDELPGILPGERASGMTLACQCRPKSDLALSE